MRCDGIPDPAVQQDINTYISLCSDDSEVNVTTVLKQCGVTLQVCILMCVCVLCALPLHDQRNKKVNTLHCCSLD